MVPARRGAESETRTRSALHSSHLDSFRPCTALDRRFETFAREESPVGYAPANITARVRVEKVDEEEQVACCAHDSAGFGPAGLSNELSGRPLDDEAFTTTRQRGSPHDLGAEKDDEEERRSLAPFSLVSAPFTLD